MDELLASAMLMSGSPTVASAADKAGRAEMLHRLVGDWQLLADLSFADLVLFAPDADAGQFVVIAQMRPTTGPTAYQDDLVGIVVSADDHPQLAAAYSEGRIVREGDPVWVADTPVREEALPVVLDGRIIAVVARATNLNAARTPSQLEIAYLRSANELAQMLAEGSWPYPGESAPEGGPRVGDGFVRLDGRGVVTFASPNALSAYRRLGHVGDLAGSSLSDITAALGGRSAPGLADSAPVVARGRAPSFADAQAGDVVVQLRALPLRIDGEHIGALVLVHDVTELRRRERALLTKDATIREIHHRVKNNLQTVAALLRLQARRMAVPEARAALEESVRRVSSIAVVHETLSGTLDEAMSFDDVADRVLSMVAVVNDSPVIVERMGSFGVLPAEIATPLAMALSELVHNAVEHGYDEGQRGRVEVIVDASAEPRLRVEVTDDGRGLPDGFDIDGSDRLGLQIVRTLVEGELGGSLSLRRRTEGGTVAAIDVIRGES
jgi:two-component sensor histidine kinase